MTNHEWLFVWRRSDEQLSEENMYYPMPNWACSAPNWAEAQKKFWADKPDIAEGDPIFVAMIGADGLMRRYVFRIETVEPTPPPLRINSGPGEFS